MKPNRVRFAKHCRPPACSQGVSEARIGIALKDFQCQSAVLRVALQNLLPLLHFFVKVRIVETRKFRANLIDSATVLSKLPVVRKSGFEFL